MKRVVALGVLLALAGAGTARADRAEVRKVAPKPAADTLEAVPLPDPLPAVIWGDYDQSSTGPGQPIWMANGDRPEVYWHELGHHFDYTRLDDGERNRFRRALHDNRGWRTVSNSPHEQFAEAYSLCALNLGRNGGYGYQPSWRQHRWVCRFIYRASD